MNKKTVGRVFGYLRRYPGLALLTLFFAAAGTVMVIVFPRVTGEIINNVVRAHHPELLRGLIFTGLASVHGAVFVQWAADHREQYVRAEGDLRSAERSVLAYAAVAVALV